jgi:hypothetical protein
MRIQAKDVLTFFAAILVALITTFGTICTKSTEIQKQEDAAKLVQREVAAATATLAEPGKVLQVVTTRLTEPYEGVTVGDTWSDTPFTLRIAPKRAGSKIVVIASMSVRLVPAASEPHIAGSIRIVSDKAVLGAGALFFNDYRQSITAPITVFGERSVPDSSPILIGIQVMPRAGTTLSLPNSCGDARSVCLGPSTIVAFEIAQSAPSGGA